MKKFLCLFFLFLIARTAIVAQTSMSNFQQDKSWWHIEGTTEEQARRDIDLADDLLPIEGIWQSSDGFQYIIERIYDSKNNVTKLIMVVLKSTHGFWSRGEIKALIEFGSVDNVYAMTYYVRNNNAFNTAYQQIMLMQESPILLTYTPHVNDGNSYGKVSLYRIYPRLNSEESIQERQDGHSIKEWSGSGIAIDSKFVVTNYHVVDGANTLKITSINGNTRNCYNAEVVAVDKFNDLAIIEVVDTAFIKFPSLKYGVSFTTKDVGTNVFVLGYPLVSTMGEEIKLTNGIISAKSGYQGNLALYQISAPIQPGNSGGPLFDNDGNLIGIVSAKHTNTENVGYAIKLSYLKNLIESANLNIHLSSTNSVANLNFEEKVKSVSPVVVMVKASNSVIYTDDIKNQHLISNQSTFITPSTIIKSEELHRKSLVSEKSGDLLLAYEYIEQSIKVYKSVYNMSKKGELAVKLNKNTEALEAFLYCIKKNFHPSYYHYMSGELYSKIGDNEKAVYHFTYSLNNYDLKDINKVQLLFGIALCYENINKEEALKYYHKTLEYDGKIENNYSNRSRFATCYNNIAYCYLYLDSIDNRIDINITAALEYTKLEDFIWDTDGEYAYKIGDYKRCINSMNNAIAIAKSNKSKDRGNSYLYRGLAYLQLGDSLHAYRDLERAVEQHDSIAKIEINRINVSSLDFSMEPENKMIRKPSISKNKSTYLTLEAVEHTDDCTILYFSSTEKTGYPYYSMNEKAYIRDKSTGIKYPLISTENCAIERVHNAPTPYKDGKACFQIYFPKLPNETSIIDFVESEESEWRIYGIKIK